jgi:hypothetical protein
MDIDEDLIIDEDEQLAQNTYLFSPMYSRHHNECSLCIFQYITEYEEQIRTFERKLVDINSKLGCGIQTCVTMVLNEFKDDERMSLFTKLTTSEITSHFDSVFGYPMCGYNRLKAYNFFSLFDESTVNNSTYIKFIYDTYKTSRNTSLCPYSLLGVYVFLVMINTIGGDSQLKKKHDFLWMFNCLYNHKLRFGKLR